MHVDFLGEGEKGKESPQDLLSFADRLRFRFRKLQILVSFHVGPAFWVPAVWYRPALPHPCPEISGISRDGKEREKKVTRFSAMHQGFDCCMHLATRYQCTAPRVWSSNSFRLEFLGWGRDYKPSTSGAKTDLGN